MADRSQRMEHSLSNDDTSWPGSEPLILHGYFRSSAAYRVRIALALKGLAFTPVSVHLVRGGGEQHAAAFKALNPLGLVPVLQHGGLHFSQSLAIIEYLEDTHPAVPLLPSTPALRARARQLALMIACDIHPLNNLRVLGYLASRYPVDQAGKADWMRHWMEVGFAALEAELAAAPSTRFCVGETPTIADCCLVPQVFNARRFDVDLAPYPSIARIDAACAELPAFIAAHPARQPDAE